MAGIPQFPITFLWLRIPCSVLFVDQHLWACMLGPFMNWSVRSPLRLCISFLEAHFVNHANKAVTTVLSIF